MMYYVSFSSSYVYGNASCQSSMNPHGALNAPWVDPSKGHVWKPHDSVVKKFSLTGNLKKMLKTLSHGI